MLSSALPKLSIHKSIGENAIFADRAEAFSSDVRRRATTIANIFPPAAECCHTRRTTGFFFFSFIYLEILGMCTAARLWQLTTAPFVLTCDSHETCRTKDVELLASSIFCSRIYRHAITTHHLKRTVTVVNIETHREVFDAVRWFLFNDAYIHRQKIDGKRKKYSGNRRKERRKEERKKERTHTHTNHYRRYQVCREH